MFALNGYSISQKIYTGNGRIYYSGYREDDKTPVMIKSHLLDTIGVREQGRLKHEFEVLRSLAGDSFLKAYALVEYSNGLALVLEPIKGVPLSSYVASGASDLVSKLDIFISIAKCLGDLQQYRVIYKDIQINNFFYDASKQVAKLIDYRYASFLPQENPKISTPETLEGTPEYVSPEQTGRVNRILDFRTDFYSSGVLFYLILTGQMPFVGEDPLEIIHGHLARQPVDPHEVDSGIPTTLSLVVMKLLSKDVEERYQSAQGLLADLIICRRQLVETGNIKLFPPGQEDVSETLRISQKIYGREHESGLLTRVFERASGGPVELMAVSGRPGVGKTSLIQEVFIPLSLKGAGFVSGKFDPYQSKFPYLGLVHAFKELIQQILTESDDKLQYWKQALLVSLGQYGQLLIDVIPELELVMGPQPPVRNLDSAETINRFNRIFLQFVRVFARPEHPLVIFLDDLQWVDAATLTLMEQILMDDSIENLFLIGVYRDDEITAIHPLAKTLTLLEEENCKINRIRLDSLTSNDVIQLVTDTLQGDRDSISPLGEVVAQKTGSNPFFVNQFLIMLAQENLLWFDVDEGKWAWNLASIEGLDTTANVIDLMIRRLEHLSDETRDILKMAACIGTRFDLGTLRIITQKNAADISRQILPAIEMNLVDSVADIERGVVNGPCGDVLITSFRFKHDRIQQAFYDLIQDENIGSLHLRIGRLILANVTEDEKENRIFIIVRHFNLANDLIKDCVERDDVARLNLLAAVRARSSAAFETAFEYFSAGIGFLDRNCWENNYQLTLSLYEGGVETARNRNDFKKMSDLAAVVIRNAKSIPDQASVYQSMILSSMAKNHPIQALETAITFLNQIGETIPREVSTEMIRSSQAETLKNLADFNLEEQLQLRAKPDRFFQATIRVTRSILSSTYLGNPTFYPLIVHKFVNLSIRYGGISDIAAAYCSMASTLCGIDGDTDLAYHYAHLGLDLLSRTDAREQDGMAYFGVGFLVEHWKISIRDTLGMLVKGYQSGVETGDFEFASYNAFLYCIHTFLSGKPLEKVFDEMVFYGDAIKQLKQISSFGYHSVFKQVTLNLMQKKTSPWLLIGDAYDERNLLTIHQQFGDQLAIFYYYFSKMMLYYLFDLYPESVSYADKTWEYIDSPQSQAILPACFFYDSLGRMAVYAGKTKEERAEILKIVIKSQESMKRWADNAPMNQLHRYHLVEAEIARNLKNDDQAIVHYNYACELSKEHGFLQEEALANELTARFCLEKGQSAFAGLFMQRALHCYGLWGAISKIDHLLEKYRDLFVGNGSGIDSLSGKPAPALRWSASQDPNSLDRMTMIKASQAISGEIVLPRLLTTLMKIVIENTGAETGFLILESEGKLQIAARGSSDKDEVTIFPFEQVQNEDEHMAAAIVFYVARTRKYMVMDNAAELGPFTKDCYIRTHQPKSVLCMPVIHKSRLSGILYLENRLVSGVFSPGRLEVLEILASQVAISIENARLFEQQKQAEEKYRNIFINAVEGIFQATPDGKFINANPATALIFGYNSAEELCRKITDIPSQLYSNDKTHEESLRLIEKQGQIDDFEVQCFRKDGTQIWISLNARPIYNDNKKMRYFEGFIFDITERKRATEALKHREKILRKENLRLRSSFKDRYRFGDIIGRSPAMQEVYELILKATATDAGVIIYGESGTGKELVARAIYEMSDRKKGEFVPVNCSAIPENLLESEFFGYRKGAFTGANMNKKGALEIAHGGVLFLDELGEIDLSFQVKLLRVLENGEYKPLGGQTTQISDARIIAATNRNLQDAVQQGLIREDFFYRIHVIPIELPPLRDRKEDIPLLIDHFVKRQPQGKSAVPITGDLLNSVLEHDWPGNVRELQNVLQRFFTLGTLDIGGKIQKPSDQTISTIPQLDIDDQNFNYHWEIESLEKKLILQTLEKFQWNRKRAAEKLNIPLRSFHRKLQQLNIASKG